MGLRKHARFLYQPVLPLGKNGRFVTNSKPHWDLAGQIAAEGTVLLKNDGTLPLKEGARICLFGLGAGDFLFGGGGSGGQKGGSGIFIVRYRLKPVGMTVVVR